MINVDLGYYWKNIECKSTLKANCLQTRVKYRFPDLLIVIKGLFRTINSKLLFVFQVILYINVTMQPIITIVDFNLNECLWSLDHYHRTLRISDVDNTFEVDNF